MNKKFLAGMATVATFALTACGNSQANVKPAPSTNSVAATSKSLIVSTFALSQDIVERDIIEPFKKQTGINVTLEVGNASERLTKVQSGSSAVDVIELSQAASTKALAKNVLETVTVEQVPNLAHLTPAAQNVWKNGGGVPFSVNSLGIIYNKEKLGRELKTWADLWSADLKGKIAIPEISTTMGPLFLAVASEQGGTSLDVDKGQSAFKTLSALKPNVVKTYTKSSDLANMFQAGEISVAVVGDFAIKMIQKADPKATHFVPESGTYANFNTVNLVKNAKNKDAALAYINHRLSQENQTLKAKSLSEAPVNAKVELTAEASKNMTYGDVAKRAKALDFKLINENLASWTDQWNRILNQ